MKDSEFLLVNINALPPVFEKVVQVKELLRSGQVSSTAEAVRIAGISRSVYYKYKDSVFPYSDKGNEKITTIRILLFDRPGVLMSVISQFTAVGANILTINQSIPVNGEAIVSISAKIDSISEIAGSLVESLKAVDGVKNIESIVSE